MNTNQVQRKLKTSIFSILFIVSLLVIQLFISIHASACHYTVGTFESDYSTPKSFFYKGEVVYGMGTLDVNRQIKLRIIDPAGNIVFYSEVSIYTVYCSFIINDTAPTGVWSIQLGENISGCWKWSIGTGRISYFTVGSADFTLTINVDGNGSVLKNPDKITYNYGEVISLTSVPDSCSSFSNWGGDLSGNNNPETIIMNNNKIVISHFIENQYTLTINIVGNGTVLKNPDQGFYTCGSFVELTAETDEGFIFNHWEGDILGNSNPIGIVIDTDKVISAVFTEPFYTLSINIDPTGSGIVNDDISGPYHYGDIVNLTAVPIEGFEFSSWSGDLSGNENPKSITIDGDKTVTAIFESVVTYYILTINIEGSGSVEKNPDQIFYANGTLVELTAIPDSGFVFDYWSGDLTGNNNPEDVSVTDNKTITAHFKSSQSSSGDNGGGNSVGTSGLNTPKPNNCPVAKAGGPYYGFIDEIITFNGSKSYDLDQSIDSFYWDFGDSSSDYGEILNHTYQKVGQYIVTLTVTDTKGAIGIDETISVIISPNSPPSEPIFTGPNEGIINDFYGFSVLSNDFDGDELKYAIEWGDGEITESNFISSGQSFDLSHRWIKPGIYTIKISADDGETNTTTEFTIDIKEPIKSDIPEQNNYILIIFALLALMILLLLLVLAKRKKDDEEEEKKE